MGFFMFKLSEQVRSTHSEDGAIVLDIFHGQMFRLNVVGSRMLELLKHDYSEAAIAEEISREFRIGREIVAADLHEFLSHLEKHHLLERRSLETQPGL